ncbi:MAG: hypothetical protein HZA24_08745 [Nitrospirae bacterium]|nr:hypothetical protein [Nitrospirota bacterium]
MPPPHARCPLCGADLGHAGQPGRRDQCPACLADLHACHACRFHDPRAHNQCREPKAEWQPKRDRANFCDLFELAEQPAGKTGAPDRETDRQRQLDDLFKNF